MEQKIYVIYWDSQDDYCEIKGYVTSEEEAKKYCNEHPLYEYESIENLSNKGELQ